MNLQGGTSISIADGEESATLEATTRTELHRLFLEDGRPWVVAFSGGKDSTLVLQLVYAMLLELGPRTHKPVFVVTTDTGVEAPNVSHHVCGVLDVVRNHAVSNRLPLEVHLVGPEPARSFWGKLIGQGYPSPTRWFRWCTSNMKIRPARAVIERITRTYGSVVLLLGTRIEESAERGKRIRARELTARGLNPHHEIPNALVATPIVHWSTDQVWDYLFTHNPPPWGGSHDFLLALYRKASGGECPVVLDLSTPSCGGSRFGCWTCTVVKEDKSLQGFIQSGEAWMEPLNAFRNRLKEVRELPDWRSAFRKDGSPGPGPFLPEKRRLLLRELLELERRVGQPLISDAEIQYIQSAWRTEFDLKDEALQIAAEYGRTIGAMETLQLPNTEQQLLDQLVAERGISPDLVERLLRLVLTEYPDLRVWGAKAALQREIEAAIGASLSQEDAAGVES